MNATHATAGIAIPARRSTTPQAGATYYLDRDIHVTQRCLFVQGAWFVVDDLDEVGVDREPCPPEGIVASIAAAVSSVVLAVGLASGAMVLAVVAGIAV